MLGEGVYLSRDVTKAAHYPLDVAADDYENRVILECLVHVGKVKRIDSANHPMQKTWMILGYDTAWVPPACGMVPSGLEEDCVWSPDRIIVLRRVQVLLLARAHVLRFAVSSVEIRVRVVVQAVVLGEEIVEMVHGAHVLRVRLVVDVVVAVDDAVGGDGRRRGLGRDRRERS